MSRSRNIEPEAALQAAMDLFWQYGYTNLGTRQIEEETGITRFTLQTSYGGKRHLFLMSLDAYLDRFEVFAKPECNEDNLEGIARWFESRTDPPIDFVAGKHGCLMLNTIVEFGALDPDINQRAQRYFQTLRNGFRSALAAANGKFTVCDNVDIEQKSEILLGAALGLNIVIRSAADNTAGHSMATAVAKMVRQWVEKSPTA